MKTKFVELAIPIFKAVLRAMYFILKILPVKNNKVIFCSRQMDEVPLDFFLIQECLKEKNSDIICVNVCRRVGNDIIGYLSYAKALLKSMVHLATGRVCVLDSYWPAVSLLKHKQELTVIQIWHAIGKIKKSGYASVGKKSGRKIEYAKKLHMHKNYDYIIAGAKSWNEFYCESFGVNEEIILNYGLPRIDYLKKTEEKNRKCFFFENPELQNKKIVLYTPTFRRNMKSQWSQIVKIADINDIALIIKTHPGEKIKSYIDKSNVYYFDGWKTIDLIAVCDYLITDYSAIALEAAVLKRKTFFWVYDYDEYVENNGLNLDLYGTVPMHVFEDINELAEYIEKDRFDENAFNAFCNKYLPEELGTSTQRIAETILKNM